MLSGPLVHERLLELQRQDAPDAGIAVVDEPREVASLERDVLACVDRPAPELAGPEIALEALDQLENGEGRSGRERSRHHPLVRDC